MKPTVATSLSLVAVLCAGVLAAAANLRVFAGPDPTVSAGTVGAAGLGAAEAGAAGTTAPEQHAGGPRTFDVGRAGSVTLDATGGIHVVRLDPAPGWLAERQPAPAGTLAVVFAPPSGPSVVVTAEAGPEGIRVFAREAARPVIDVESEGGVDADDD
jgi:hypothetical protein